ncbi:MAG: hypothetical protein AAGN35_11345 [Bacteroidota bacterium]
METPDEHRDDLSGKFEDFEFPVSDAIWCRVEIEIDGDTKPGALADHLGGYVHVPQPHVWDRIIAATHPTRRRATAIWWLASAAALVFLLLIGWRFGGGNPEADHTALPHFAQEQPNRPTPPTENRTATPRDDRKPSAPRSLGNRTLAEQGLSELLFAYPGRGTASDEAPPPQLDERRDLNQIPSRFPAFLTQTRNARAGRARADSVEAAYLRQQERRKEEIWLANNARMAEDQEQYGYAAALSSGFAPSSSLLDFVPSLRNETNDETFLSQSSGGDVTSAVAEYSPAARRENFRTPFTVGFQLRKALSKRLSLGLGPVYTSMLSTRDQFDGSLAVEQDIRRQYLGVSLDGNYAFVKKQVFSSYFMVGLRYDFGLGVRITQREFEGGNLTAEETNRSSQGPLALTTAGIGIDYDLTNALGFYLQASVSRAIFTTHPTLWVARTYWPGAQVGFRLRL